MRGSKPPARRAPSRITPSPRKVVSSRTHDSIVAPPNRHIHAEPGQFRSLSDAELTIAAYQQEMCVALDTLRGGIAQQPHSLHYSPTLITPFHLSRHSWT
jgi:hypothetical protein